MKRGFRVSLIGCGRNHASNKIGLNGSINTSPDKIWVKVDDSITKTNGDWI